MAPFLLGTRAMDSREHVLRVEQAAGRTDAARRAWGTERLALWTAWSLAALGTAVHVVYYFPRVVDDLFISLRYAHNVVHGLGPVYNAGEHVEGYSSPLWMWLQALGLLCRFEGVTWTKAMGIAALASIHVALYRTGRDLLQMRPLASVLPCLFLAANSYAVNWALLGLETAAHLALLLAFPLVLHAALSRWSRATALAAGAVTIALCCVRPEAPLYVFFVGLAVVLRPAASRTWSARLRAALRLALPVGATLLVLLLWRRFYFGSWVAHTYYVKGADAAFQLAKLAPLIRQGASAPEAIVYVTGIASLLIFGALRGEIAPAIASLVCLVFTVQVEVDWMPSLRHLLPVTILAPVGSALAIDTAWSARQRWPRLLALLSAIVAVLAAADVAAVDNRMSPAEASSGWVRPKRWALWRDAMFALRRLEPPDVAEMDEYWMGQISQVWPLLETSARPLEAQWFVGRDIGAVGYYTGAKIFDTAGLFTPDVVADRRWRTTRAVDDELIRKAMGRRPVAAELYDGWDTALGRNPSLRAGYTILDGSEQRPRDIVLDDPTPPAVALVLQRYDDLVARFPRSYFLATLYGESVGAVVERRARIVRRKLLDQSLPPVVGETPPEAGSMLCDGAVEALGCRLDRSELKAGEEFVVDCSYRVHAPLERRHQIFFHFESDAPSSGGAPRFAADHAPTGGLRPTTTWREGEVVRDVHRVEVPIDRRPGRWSLHYGLFAGSHRCSVRGRWQDGTDRLLGPSIRIVR